MTEELQAQLFDARVRADDRLTRLDAAERRLAESENERARLEALYAAQVDIATTSEMAGQRLREAVEHVVNDSPGTPESVKQYLRAALAPLPLDEEKFA